LGLDEFDESGPAPSSNAELARVIKLDVGGTLFTTTFLTLTRVRSMFTGMLSGNFSDERAYFIDRDPTYFRYILNYLRDGTIDVQELSILHRSALLKEAKFYQINGLLRTLEISERNQKIDFQASPSMEKEYKLMVDVKNSELSSVFQKMTCEENYDFESWAISRPSSTNTAGQGNNPGAAEALVNVLFSRQLSNGDVRLLNRLRNM
jgi:hypothetical protein